MSDTLIDPASRAWLVTPSDNQQIVPAARAIGVNVEGYVQLTTVGGDVIRIWMVPGAPYPVRTLKVWQAGTTAGEIIALA